jgi:hypothetical protein
VPAEPAVLEDAAQVRLGEPLDLARQARPLAPEVLPPLAELRVALFDVYIPNRRPWYELTTTWSG